MNSIKRKLYEWWATVRIEGVVPGLFNRKNPYRTIWEKKMIPTDNFEKNSNQYGGCLHRRIKGWHGCCPGGHFLAMPGGLPPLRLCLQCCSITSGLRAPPQPNQTLFTKPGLIAFIMPGLDPYSGTQIVSTEEPGGMDANITDAFIVTLDLAQPQTVIPKLLYEAAFILNSYALYFLQIQAV